MEVYELGERVDYFNITSLVNCTIDAPSAVPSAVPSDYPSAVSIAFPNFVKFLFEPVVLVSIASGFI